MLEEAKPVFIVPNEKVRAEAIGKFMKKTKLEKATFFSIREFYLPVPEPGPSDWLACHPTPPQTFTKYKISGRTEVSKLQNKIYIIPLDVTMNEDFLLKLQIICSAFYTPLEVKIIKYVPLKTLGVTSRKNDGVKQYNASQILEKLSDYQPKDAYCLMGITNMDLYPSPSWNYVFGMANLKRRTGVFSFARYNPAFFGEKEPPNLDDLILRRAYRTMVHEIGHMFGLLHCVFYCCIMNGANHSNDASQKAVDLCPVCLRKLQLATNFNYLKRFIAMEKVFSSLTGKFKRDAEWLQRRITVIEEKLEVVVIIKE